MEKEDLFSEEKENLQIISESDLKSFFRCPYAHYLQKHVGMSKIPKTAFAAEALFFSQARKSLYNLYDSAVGRVFPYQTRAGPQLKPAEMMSAEELQQYLAYSSADSFGSALFGKWMALAKNSRYAGSELAWNFNGQPHCMGKELQKAGENYYGFVLSNGAPLAGFVNKEIAFQFEGSVFKIKFPELRKGMFLDDPTLWKFSAEAREDNGTNLDKSALVTLRILGYCTLASEFPLYRRKWEIPEEIAEQWAGKPFLDERIKYRHFNASEGNVSVSTRTNSDLDNLRQLIETYLKHTSREQFIPNHKQCNACSYNTVGMDGKVICWERKSGIKPSLPNYYFPKRNFRINSEHEDNSLIISGRIAKNPEVTKLVAKYQILFQDLEGVIQATSQYFSEARGFGFEEQLLKEADQQLQALAKSKGRAIVHEIDFRRDFQFAGQRSIAKLLQELGYEENKKIYL